MSGRQLFWDPLARLANNWWVRRQIKSHEATIDAIGNGIDAACELRTELRIELRGLKSRTTHQ
jgi:hypothetical protein